MNVGTKNMISENVILVKLEKFNFLNILKKINKNKKIKTNSKINIEKLPKFLIKLLVIKQRKMVWEYFLDLY